MKRSDQRFRAAGAEQAARADRAEPGRSAHRLLEVHRRCYPASALHPVKTAGTTTEKTEPVAVDADPDGELLAARVDDDDAEDGA